MSVGMDWRFHVALLVIAHETGHCMGAIRKLRCSDVDMVGGVIRWWAEHQNTGYEHWTPMDGRCARCAGRGTKGEPRDRRCSSAPSTERHVEVRQPVVGVRLVGKITARHSPAWNPSGAVAGTRSGGGSPRTS